MPVEGLQFGTLPPLLPLPLLPWMMLVLPMRAAGRLARPWVDGPLGVPILPELWRPWSRRGLGLHSEP